MSHHSLNSSISSQEDQFDVLRMGSGSSSSRPAPSHSSSRAPTATTMKATPTIMKTPTMETLTRKYEFLLGNDKDDDDGIENDDDDDAYFRTPPPSASKLERTRSHGSRNSSRHSSRDSSPARSIVRRTSLSAHTILHRLDSFDEKTASGPPRRMSAGASPSVDEQHISSGRKYRSMVKQNLEQRLKQFEEQTPPKGRSRQSESPSRSHHHRQRRNNSTPPVVRYPQQRTKRQSPFHKAFAQNFSGSSKNNKVELLQRQEEQHQHQQSMARHNAEDAPNSPAATSTTMGMSDATTTHRLDRLPTTTLLPDTEVREEEQPQHDDVASEPAHPSVAATTSFAATTTTSVSSVSVVVNPKYEEDKASFWHRWKMAEKRMQLQQEQFEGEKEEWVRQLESAYDANSKVEALAKRMEVQLLAVHKTCLQQDEDDNVDEEEEAAMVPQPKEEPIDPLHLLMLKESGVANIEDFQQTDSDEWGDNHRLHKEGGEMDSFEYTERLERRQARTRTKNVILSHLVKLLERQAEEQKMELRQQLKSEKEERQELWQEFRQLERRLEQQQQVAPQDADAQALSTPQKPSSIVAAGLVSPQPTDSDQHKALQHRLWLREQQYEQERKEYDAKLEALQAECDRYKHQTETTEQKLVTSRLLGTAILSSTGEESVNQNVDVLQTQLDSLIAEKEDLQTECESLQTHFKDLQLQVCETERAHNADVLEEKEEHARTDKQLATAVEELEEMTDQWKAMEAKMERMESKHGRERKQWEWSLMQQGKRADSISAGNISNNILGQMEKQRELELSQLESQLQAAQSDAQRLHHEVKSYKEQEAEALTEKRELESQLESLCQRTEQMDLEGSDEKPSADMPEKNEGDKEEYMQELEMLRGELEKKNKEIADLRARVEESKAEVPMPQSQTSEKREEKGAYEKQGFTKQLEEKITKLELSLQVERENLEEAHGENSRLTGVVQQLTSAHQSEIRDLEVRMQSFFETEEVGERIATLDDSMSQGLQMAEKYEDLDTQLQDATKELEECQRYLEDESAKCKQAMEKNGGLELEIQQLGKQHQEEKSELTCLVDSLKCGTDSRTEALTRFENLSKKNEELESTLRETHLKLSATLQSLESETSKCRETNEAKTALEKELQELDVGYSKEREQPKNRYDCLQNESKTAHYGLEEKVAGLEASTQLLQIELETIESAYRLSEESNSKLNMELQNLNEKFVQEMNELKCRFQSLHSDSAGAQNALETKESNHRELEEKWSFLNVELKEENADLRSRIQQLEEELGTKESSQLESEERHSALNVELRTLNERLMGEMKEMESRYQSLRSESMATQNDLEGKNASFECQLQGLQDELSSLNVVARATPETPDDTDDTTGQESGLVEPAQFNEKNDTLDATIIRLQNELGDANAALELATEKTSAFDREVEELSEAFAKEKDEWESQIQQLATCESIDSVRTQELVEQNAERERQLEEAKKEVEVGIKAIRAESEKYRTVVQNNSSLDAEIKQLQLEKNNWVKQLETLRNESKGEHLVVSAKNVDLSQQVQELKNIHENTLKDWRLGSEQSNEEIYRLQHQQDNLLLEKATLLSQVAAAERQIEVMQTLHQADTCDWREQIRLAGQQSVETCANAVDELKREVLKMGEDIVASSQTIKDFAANRNEEESLLGGFDRIQRDMAESAAKIAEESREMGSNQEAFIRRLVEIEQVLEASSNHKGAPIDIEEHKALLEQVRDICLRSEALSSSRTDEVASRELAQCKVEFAIVKAALRKTTHDLESETSKREDAEKQVDELNMQLCGGNKERKQSQSMGVYHKNDSFDSDNDLDMQLADLGAQIDSEMEQIRSIMCDESRAIVATDEDNEEISSARQAMTAQTLLLVQSLRDLIYQDNDGDEDEESPTTVMQHLEILSELMGEVDVIESALVPSSGREETAPKVQVGESDLLRFELAQDDTMLDLLHDMSQDQSLLHDEQGTTDDATSGNMATVSVANAAGLANTSGVSVKRSGIELVVEQTYNRCQVLERERCDLINVTLDLLSSAREANQAEISAALATARRKAAEEMIAMRKETQAEVNQIWWKLCDKCRHGLTHC